MKPVLIIYDYLQYGYSGVPWGSGNATPPFTVLDRLNIPYRIQCSRVVGPNAATTSWAVDKFWGGATDSLGNTVDWDDYSAIVLPMHRAFNDGLSDMHKYTKGDIPLPVFAWCPTDYAANSGAYVSGATSCNTTTDLRDGQTYFTLDSIWGKLAMTFGSAQRGYVLDASAENLVYQASTGLSVAWRRQGTAGTVYWCCDRGQSITPWLLMHFLGNEIADAPKTRIPICITLDLLRGYDGSSEYGDTETGLANIAAFVSWMRENNAVALVDWEPASWTDASAELKALDKANGDVLINNYACHEPTDGNSNGILCSDGWEGTDLSTVELRKAAYQAGVDAMAAAGLPIEDCNEYGVQLLAWHKVDEKGLQMLCDLGYKAVRTANSLAGLTPWGTSYLPSPATFTITDENKTVWGINELGEVSYDVETLAAYATAMSQSEAQLIFNMQYFGIYRRLVQQWGLFCLAHGANFAGDLADWYFYTALEPVVKMASPLIRWGTVADWKNILRQVQPVYSA